MSHLTNPENPYNNTKIQNGASTRRLSRIMAWLEKHPEVTQPSAGHVRFLWDGEKIKVAKGETGALE